MLTQLMLSPTYTGGVHEADDRPVGTAPSVAESAPALWDILPACGQGPNPNKEPAQAF